MRFGLFHLMQRDPLWSEDAVYEAELAQMCAAEALGYESVWIAEHHFSDYGLCPVPPIVAASIAARTTRLRIGMGVSLLPLHDPVRLAEDLAVLDQVSGGRLDVGIGRGGAGESYEAFGATFEESRDRVAEGIALMRRCWSGERFSFAGRFRTIEEVRVTPRPRQRPHPPLFIAANSPDSNLFAARQGLPTLSSFFVPTEELVRRRATYREEAHAAGHDAATVVQLDRQSAGMRCVFVAHDRAEAIRIAGGPFMAYQERLAARANVKNRLTYARLRPFEEYLDLELALFGSPAEVADGLARYHAATGYERVFLLMSLAGVPLTDTLRSMELCATVSEQ